MEEYALKVAAGAYLGIEMFVKPFVEKAPWWVRLDGAVKTAILSLIVAAIAMVAGRVHFGEWSHGLQCAWMVILATNGGHNILSKVQSAKERAKQRLETEFGHMLGGA